MIRVDWCGRVLFEDDMVLKLGGLAVKHHKGGNNIRTKGPKGKCICYM